MSLPVKLTSPYSAKTSFLQGPIDRGHKWANCICQSMNLWRLRACAARLICPPRSMISNLACPPSPTCETQFSASTMCKHGPAIPCSAQSANQYSAFAWCFGRRVWAARDGTFLACGRGKLEVKAHGDPSGCVGRQVTQPYTHSAIVYHLVQPSQAGIAIGTRRRMPPLAGSPKALSHQCIALSQQSRSPSNTTPWTTDPTFSRELRNPQLSSAFCSSAHCICTVQALY